MTAAHVLNTEEGAAELRARAVEWLREAKRLEESVPLPTLEQRVGDALLMRRIHVDELVNAWFSAAADPAKMCKSEFRSNLRAFALAEPGELAKGGATTSECDALFAEYSLADHSDHSEGINADVLKPAFYKLQEEAREARVACIAPREQAARLRKKAALVKEAAEAAAAAEVLEEEYKQLQQALDGSLEVQLGVTLSARRIAVGQLVGTWADGAMNSVHKGELSKAAFRAHIQELLPKAAFSAAAVNGLFDSIDVDSSGWLDLNEAKQALKALRQRVEEAVSRR